MVDVQFSPATTCDLFELAIGLRPLDHDELVATAGSDVLKVLDRSRQVSDDPVAVKSPAGELIAVFGIAPATLLSDTAAPWLLGTHLMTPYAKRILFHARRYITFVRERYPRLENYVDARNEPSLRWLKSVGFTVDDQPVPYGVARLPFYRFHMGCEDV